MHQALLISQYNYTLCIVIYAKLTMHCQFCIIHFASCITHYAFNIMNYVLGITHASLLCRAHYEICIVYNALCLTVCNLYHVLAPVHLGSLWYTMVSLGSSWFIMIHHGSSWFIMVHHWFNMVHHGSPWFITGFKLVQCLTWQFLVQFQIVCYLFTTLGSR